MTNLPFASILLFVLGIFKKWWRDFGFAFVHIYSVLWLVGFFANLYFLKENFFDEFKKRSFNFRLKRKANSIFKAATLKIEFLKIYLQKTLELKNLIYLITHLYLFYLGAQAPFVRYFVIILPFLYLTLAEFF